MTQSGVVDYLAQTQKLLLLGLRDACGISLAEPLDASFRSATLVGACEQSDKKLLVPNQLLPLNTWLPLNSNTRAPKHVLLLISGVNSQSGPHSL